MDQGEPKPKIPTPQQERSFWEQRLARGWGEGKPPDAYLVKFFEKYRTEIGPLILDIGCGNGRHIIPMVELGYEVTGVELAQTGIDATKNKLAEKGLNATIVQGDFRQLNFDSETFNTAISVQVLNQSNDWQGAKRAFSETARVLKPGGLFFLRVRSNLRPIPEGSEIVKEPADPELLIENRGVTYIKNRQIMEGQEPTQKVLQYAFSYEELVKLADKYGMDIVDEFADEQKLSEKSHWNLVFRKRI